MNEYQQALVRIIELEDRNAELLEALEDAYAQRRCPDEKMDSYYIPLTTKIMIAIRRVIV